MSDPLAAARALLAEDPDPETRAELEALVRRAEGGDEAARADLADRLAGPLEFGTAGLRGRVEAGLARMNRLAVIKATWGLGSHLLDEAARGGHDPRSRGVVVGFDGRHSSRLFAEDTAAVLTASASPCASSPIPSRRRSSRSPSPTSARRRAWPSPPATTRRATTATRSTSRAAPRSSRPADAAIAARIAAAPRAGAIPRPAPADAAAHGLRLLLDVERHRGRGGLPRRPRPTARCTAARPRPPHRLHARCTASATGSPCAPSPGPASTASRSSRRRPIPTGPSAPSPFPTPRSRARWTGCSRWPRETGAELVLANDPDADRLAAAVPDPSGRGYRMLSGNEIGVLLADDAIEHAAPDGRTKLVVTTIVSSSLLSRMARDRGVRLPGDAHRLQVDRRRGAPGREGGARLRLRLRGGARLHDGPPGAGQGRHRRRAPARGAGPLPEDRGRDPARPPRRPLRGPRPLAPGPVVGRAAGSGGPRAHRRRDGPAAREPAGADRDEPRRPRPRRGGGRGDASAARAGRPACRARTSSPSSPRTARGSRCARAAPSRRSSSTSSSWGRRGSVATSRPARARLEADGQALRAALTKELKLA